MLYINYILTLSLGLVCQSVEIQKYVSGLVDLNGLYSLAREVGSGVN